MTSLLALDELKAMEMGASVLVDSIREVRWIYCERTFDISSGWRTVVVYPMRIVPPPELAKAAMSLMISSQSPASAISNFDLKSSSAASAVRTDKVLNGSPGIPVVGHEVL